MSSERSGLTQDVRPAWAQHDRVQCGGLRAKRKGWLLLWGQTLRLRFARERVDEVAEVGSHRKLSKAQHLTKGPGAKTGSC